MDAERAMEQVVQERLTERVEGMLRLTRRDWPRSAQRLRDEFARAIDEADAWLCVSNSGARGDGGVTPENPAGDAARTVTVLRGSDADLRSAAGEIVHEFRLIPFGTVEVDRPLAGGSFEFTREHGEAAKRWFDATGRKLAIDYEHQSVSRHSARCDGLRPAAGWIGGIEVRDDGLWAVDVTWTARAADLLAGGEYRYFSPVIYWSDEQHSDLVALGPVALTNDPAMRGVAALAATRDRLDARAETGEDEAEDRDAAGTSAAAGSEEAEGLETDSGEATEPCVLRQEIAELRAELDGARARLAAQEADTFVERGLRLGKIVESTSMDWREEYLRDAEATAARLARAPVVLPPGRVMALDRRGRASGAGEALWRFRRATERLDGWGIELADLEAYERAEQAGRVRRYGAQAKS